MIEDSSSAAQANGVGITPDGMSSNYMFPAKWLREYDGASHALLPATVVETDERLDPKSYVPLYKPSGHCKVCGKSGGCMHSRDKVIP